MQLFIGYFSRLIVERQSSRSVAQELDFVSSMHALSSSCVAAYVGHVTAYRQCVYILGCQPFLQRRFGEAARERLVEQKITRSLSQFGMQLPCVRSRAKDWELGFKVANKYCRHSIGSRLVYNFQNIRQVVRWIGDRQCPSEVFVLNVDYQKSSGHFVLSVDKGEEI